MDNPCNGKGKEGRRRERRKRREGLAGMEEGIGVREKGDKRD